MDFLVLQQSCEGLPKSFYYGHSCLVESASKVVYADAVCNDLSNGHLAFVLTDQMKTAIFGKISEGLVSEHGI